MPGPEIEYEPHPDGGEIETVESWDKRMGKRYAPDADKPWRLAWGFGVFEDYADEAAARREYRRMCRDEAHLSPQEPFRTDQP